MAKGKGGSKALTGILCFIFGFLFAIIVEAALIGGGIYFLLNADIDNLLSTVGVDNYDEETGKNIYISTPTSKRAALKRSPTFSIRSKVLRTRARMSSP